MASDEKWKSGWVSGGNSAHSPTAAPTRPLTIALVIDTLAHEGNGTSNSALQYARELRRQGHAVRLVGVGAPEYTAREHHSARRVSSR